MTLQYSGSISLGQIHAEANNVSGTLTTEVDISDADVRDLVNAFYGVPIDFSDFYGASYDTGGGGGGEEP
jgi:hypothetical protein